MEKLTNIKNTKNINDLFEMLLEEYAEYAVDRIIEYSSDFNKDIKELEEETNAYREKFKELDNEKTY